MDANTRQHESTVSRSIAVCVVCLLLVLIASTRGRTLRAQDDRTEITRLEKEAQGLLAERKFRDALPLLQTLTHLQERRDPGEEAKLAETLDALGETHYSLRTYPEAAAAFERALAIYDRTLGRQSAKAANVLNNLAIIARVQGSYVRAEQLFLEALSVLEHIPDADPLDVASAGNNLASLYGARGDFARAEPMYQKAMAVYESAGTAQAGNLARAQNNLALLYQGRGELSKAAPLFERSLALRRRLPQRDDLDIALALGNLATNYQERGDLSQAEVLYDQALELYRAKSAQDATDRILLNKAMISLQRGDYAAALPLYRQAIEIRERVLGPDHPDTGAALERLAVFYQVTGQVQEAFDAFRRSAAVAELNLALNIEAGSEEQKIGYVKTLQESTDILLSMRRDLAARHPPFSRLAISTAVQRHGRVLETLVNASGQLRDSLDPAWRQLFDELSGARSRLAQLVLTRPGVSNAQRQGEMAGLRIEIDRLERMLAGVNIDARIQLRPVSIDDVVAALPADAALVQYVKYRPFDAYAVGHSKHFLSARYAAFVLRPRAEPVWVELDAADTIEKAVTNWRSALISPSSTTVQREGRIVSELLIKLVASETAGAQRLYIVPDDVLNLVPFGALPAAGGRYLLDDVGVSYLASSRDVLKFGSGPAAREPALIVAAPDFGPRRSATGRIGSGFNFTPLLGTAREGDSLARLIPNSRLAKGSAATGSLVRSVHGPVALHLATHAFFVGPRQASAPKLPAESRGLSLVDRIALDSSPLLRAGIALANANAGKVSAGQEDGVLTALEASSLDLHGTRLVVLSACETGLGEVRAGDGIHGFRRALAIAGAETQVLTLWKISDVETAQLMTEFYQGLLKGSGREAALRQAQLSMLHRPGRGHPFYWAPFVLAGATSPMTFDVNETLEK